MTEVDGILIQSLRGLGCDIAEDVTSIRSFTTEVLVQSVASCLRAINPQVEVPNRLSAAMATKYRQASVLAEACKAVGCTGDVGYEAFLYGGEHEMRRLLLFLLDKLPKEERASVGVLPYGKVFAREMSEVIGRELVRPWLPPGLWSMQSAVSRTASASASIYSYPFRSQRLVVTSGGGVPTQSQSAESEKEEDSRVVTDQVIPHRDLVASLIEFNSSKLATFGSSLDAEIRRKRWERLRERGIVPKSAQAGDVVPSPVARPKPALPPRKPRQSIAVPASTEDTGSPDGEKPVEKEERREEEEIERLKNHVISLKDTIGKMSAEVECLQVAAKKTEVAIGEGEELLNCIEGRIQMKQRMASLTDGPTPISMEKMLEKVVELKETLAHLDDQWVENKLRMVQETADLRQIVLASENSVERLKEEIRLSKSTTSTLQSELGERDEHLQLLHKEYQRFTDNSNSTSSRSSYTKRILEILSNIKKQRVEIDKIIKDTRILQKDINQLSGRLDRAFTETDELMFQDAKKDVFVRKAYKYVASFHEACAGLIATVEATGVIMRETKDLEDEVDAEVKKDKETNLQRIRDDLRQVKEENSSISSDGFLPQKTLTVSPL